MLFQNFMIQSINENYHNSFTMCKNTYLQELEITIQSKGFEYMMKWLQTMFNSLSFIE